MNDKDTKAPVYIAIIVALLLIAAAGYFVIGRPPGPTPPAGEKTPLPTPKGTAVVTVTPHGTGTPGGTPTAAPPKQVETIKCELCHTNAQSLTPHLNGGKLCINCHGSQVHNIHIGTGTVNLDCSTCHGLPPNIRVPQVEKGEGPGHYSVCENCHAAPPDNLKPSNGDLILIHLSRGKYCTNCHGTDIYAIHSAALGNATKK